MIALSTKSHLGHLRSLRVHRSNIGDKGLASIAESELWDQLELLMIGDGEMTDEGLEHLLKSGRLKNLRKVTLVGHERKWTQAGIDALASRFSVDRARW
jgi:hypothetical protein